MTTSSVRATILALILSGAMTALLVSIPSAIIVLVWNLVASAVGGFTLDFLPVFAVLMALASVRFVVAILTGKGL